ncbi:MAG: hypothetical protein K2M75_03310 [Clostridia bacterium]|nr:hypothetical protein [Clostridia bacterium]
MNLTKKSKLAALITVAVTCLAIIITACAVFAPNAYKGEDTSLTTTDINPHTDYESGGYGMSSKVQYTNSNTGAVMHDFNGAGDAGYVKILFPKTIYMDVTEDLSSLGYCFVVEAAYTGVSWSVAVNKFAVTVLDNVFGYYHSGTKKKDSNDNLFESSASNYIFMDKFSEYNVKSYYSKAHVRGIETGEDNSVYHYDNDFKNGAKRIKPDSKSEAAIVKVAMSGKPSASKVGTHNYENMTGHIMGLEEWYSTKWQTTNNSIFTRFDQNVGGTFTVASTSSDMDNSVSVGYSNNITISVNTYDKSALFNAMKSLEEKYNALVSAGLLLSSDNSRFSSFKTDVVENYLNKREVTQAQLNSKLTDVNNYYFNTYISKPSLGTEGSPKSVTYTGNKYSLNDFWTGYNNNIKNTNVKISECFPSGAMTYYPTSLDGSSTPVADKNNLVNAGYYHVTFAPDGKKRTIKVNNKDISVIFSWSSNGSSDPSELTGEVEGYLWIEPATINVTDYKTDVELTYNGKTPNKINGVPGTEEGKNAKITVVGSNEVTVQLSKADLGDENELLWNGIGSSVEFADVTQGAEKVYYRISAANHADYYGDFNVTVNPADIEIKLIEDFSQPYYSKLLDSDGIFENILDKSTRVLDAKTFEETEAYLKNILTFAIEKAQGEYFDPDTDKPDASNYSIDAIKTTAEPWASRINLITFVDDCNNNAYEITPLPIEVTWTENSNKWFNNTTGHRPSAKLDDELNTYGQEVTLSAVRVVDDKDESISAINAGTYTAKVSSTNDNFVVSNNTYRFTIKARKISIVLQDKAITYGQYGGIENLLSDYESILSQNTDNGAYIATLDPEIAAATGSSRALVHTNYKDVFTVNFNATKTPDENYYNVGEHALELVQNTDNAKNYEITATNGKFTVNPATLRVTQRQVAPKVYNGEAQNIVFPVRIANNQTGEQGTVTLYGYELANYQICVKVEYSLTGNDGTWTETPLQITNVVQSGMTVYCRVSANNHTTVKFDFEQEMSAVNITITSQGQQSTLYYGDEILNSDEIWTDFGFGYYLNERTAAEGVSSELQRAINPATIFEFYPQNPTTGQPLVNRNTNAGSYTIESRIKTGTSFDSRNYNLEFEDGCNIDAYTISKKPLQVTWEQSGNNWTGEGKDHYTYNGLMPTVYPQALSQYEGKENVVEGDSVNLESIQLRSSRHNEEGYEVTTRLLGARNQENYVLANPKHTFYIDKLVIKIVIDDQTAEYGTAQNITLGELSDPMSVDAIWDYYSGSDARFYSDDYSYYKFTSGAQSSDGSLVDAGDYKIGIVNNTPAGTDNGEVIRNNYTVVPVDAEGKSEEEGGNMAMFHIVPAKIVFTGRVYNVDLDDPEDIKNNGILKKSTLEESIATGIKGVTTNEFTIKMSERVFRDNRITVEEATAQNLWVEQTKPVSATGEGDQGAGRYHVLLYITHNRGNFEPFVEYIHFNALTDWVSIVIGTNGVTNAEYGFDVCTSDEMFEGLEFDRITGIMTEDNTAEDGKGDRQLWDVDRDAAIAKLKEYITFRVLVDSLESDMAAEIGYNASVGDFSLYFDHTAVNDGVYENFRFLPRTGEKENSNINAYHVRPRTVTINWNNMNEVYGEHGNSHSGYVITNKVGTDVVRLVLKHYVDNGVADNTARFEGDHAFAAGHYIAEAIGTTNSNYRIAATPEDPDAPNPNICKFVIAKKEYDIDLHDRSFVYGSDDALIDSIDDALNAYSPLEPNFTVTSRVEFVGNDNRMDIFRIYFKDINGLIKADNIRYLPAGTYEILGEQVDTLVSDNYQINFERLGTLTITPATAGLNRRQLNTLHFDATYQKVVIDKSWLVLEGDVDSFINNVKIGYKFISLETEEDYDNNANTEYVPEGEYKVKNAGKYVLEVEIKADNHDVLHREVNLNVDVATVVITMKQAEKTFGDTITDLNGQTPGNTDTLSKWMKYACEITITRVRDLGGGKKEEKNITASAIDDFIFYIIDENSTEDNAELPVGNMQVDVGEYSIYHKMNEDRVNEDGEYDPGLATNYNVEYARDCNVNAYKIIPRPVEVNWTVSDEANWADADKTQFYYTGHRPGLVAKFTTLADKNGVEHVVPLTLSGIDNVNINSDGQKYTARVSRSAWNNNDYSGNYTLTGDTREYSIIKRPIKVTIENQNAGTYGNPDVKGNYEIAQEQYSVLDKITEDVLNENFEAPLVRLEIEKHGVAANKFLPAGAYKILGVYDGSNYDVEFVGADGENFGLLTVNKARFDFDSTLTYNRAKYLGEDFTLDLKQILGVSVDDEAFVDGDDWEAAWENAVITFTGDEQPVFTGAGKYDVDYKLEFANYRDFSGTITVNVQKATVYLSISEVSSVYGDELLNSQQIFEKSKVVAVDLSETQKSDAIKIDFSKIITLKAKAGAVNAGRYDIEFAYVVNEETSVNQANNFNVQLVDNGNKYQILRRDVEIVWSMDESDKSFDPDQNCYVFDSTPHKINCEAKLLDKDSALLEARFEETNQKDQAGTYVARLISIGSKAEVNYKIPDECTFEWTVKPKEIRVDWTVGDYTYDGTVKVPTAQLNADDIILGTSCGLVVVGDQINAGTYKAEALTTSDNYVVNKDTATIEFTIKQKKIQVVWSNDTFVYDGEEHAPTATVKDGELELADGTIQITVGGAQKNAGTYTATIAELDNNNYTVVGASKTFKIEPKQVTIDWTVTQFDYTGKEVAPNASVKIGDIVAGDSVDLVISGSQVNVGTYTATATGVTNGNYVLAPNSVKEMEFTIEKVNNEFEGLFGKGDSKKDIVGVPWLGDNKPTDKFGGEVVIKYYDDKECTKEIDVNKIKDGTYWAVAYVEGTENYNELVSSPLEFTVDNGINLGLAIAGIAVSVVLLGAVLTIILVVSKKKKGGRA